MCEKVPEELRVDGHFRGFRKLNPKQPVCFLAFLIWVVVKTMVPFWVPNIGRHLIFRVPKKGL